PGFNLRIAKWAKKKGIKVFYYISPQIWAWHSSRVHQIKKSVDRMFVILPFEKDFYQGFDCEVDFVGHPLLDMIKARPLNPNFLTQHGLGKKPIIALLPGSRKQEITRILTGMLAVMPYFEDYEFVIAGAPSMPDQFYADLTAPLPYSVKLIQNQTYDLLQHATAALVTSGTATLETALFKVPQVVCYSGSPVSYAIAKQLINVKFISLVNLIIDRMIVRELIQHDFNLQNLRTALSQILQTKNREVIEKDYEELIQILGDAGASARTAKLMYNYLVKTP
ncbi:MAG: lipid-A-disaccharide synthase, partial [Saprospiraceae bacterium]